MGLLVSFLYLVLHCAIIILVAFLIVWLFKWMNTPIDADVYKWGKIVVGLLIVIAIAVWLSGVFGWYDFSYAPLRPAR